MKPIQPGALQGRNVFRPTRQPKCPPPPRIFMPSITRARNAALCQGIAEPRQLATILVEDRPGRHPTIVLGGFVPDSTEQVYLMRRMLFQSGSVYYVNYSRRGFSLELLCAQLDDLIEELTVTRGARPVILTVSFGGGLLVEWLRRARAAQRSADIAGAIFVSPVACIGDVLDPLEPKPKTLTARALKPYFDPPDTISRSVVERSQAIFSKMFNSGAQNRAALLGLMNAVEIERFLREVIVSIKGLDHAGASERVRALGQFVEPGEWRTPDCLGLTEAPTLILYAESEGSVLTGNSPTRSALEGDIQRLFPSGECRVVTGGSNPVQHASLIFHHLQFLPHVEDFYRELKARKVRVAA